MLPDGKPALCTGVVFCLDGCDYGCTWEGHPRPCYQGLQSEKQPLLGHRMVFIPKENEIKENSLKFVCPASNQEKRSFNLLL